MPGRLHGKTAIVFGAGSSGPGWGNGKAAAVAYAREGAAVACIDLNGDAAEETARIIAGEGGQALARVSAQLVPESAEGSAARCRIDVFHAVLLSSWVPLHMHAGDESTIGKTLLPDIAYATNGRNGGANGDKR